MRERMPIAAALTAVLAGLLSMAGCTWAQGYPAKPLRLVVGFSAGSAADFTGRLLAQKLAEPLGQTVIVDNRSGADGMIGTEQVAKAAPDGYTLLISSTGPMVINPALSLKMPYDTVKDFSPITLVVVQPLCLVVHPSLPVKSVKELVALAKAKPGQLNYGSGGIGKLLVESLTDADPSDYVRSLSPDRFTEKSWDRDEARRQAAHVYETYYGV